MSEKFSHAETLPFEVATDARSTVSLLSCYSQYSPELKSRLSLTADELDDLQLRWEKHADIFRALVKKTEYPADNSNTGETPLLAPAYLLLPTPNLQHAMSPQNSSIVRASTPDAPLHVHPLGCSPLSTPSPHPHSGPRSLQVEVAVIQNSSIVRASTPHAPLQVHPLGGSPPIHPFAAPTLRPEVQGAPGEKIYAHLITPVRWQLMPACQSLHLPTNTIPGAVKILAFQALYRENSNSGDSGNVVMVRRCAVFRRKSVEIEEEDLHINISISL
ncbi:hypothetical protein B0H14DRAFT_2579641 [Mycena olivaceomarginata]|nr:hypothetical protein B0H14DRAFT_2579641 [Mycena olivaceomarginata]